MREPLQIVGVGGQDVGLLVVQILNAVLDLAQEDIGLRQCGGGLARHQTRPSQLSQCIYRGAHAQFGVLAAAHDLQQLHGKFNFADAAARDFYVVGPHGVAWAAAGGVGADWVVQLAQCFVHVEVEVAAKDKGQHHMAQLACGVVGNRCNGRNHTAFEPGKTLPFAPLYLQVFSQRLQRRYRRARVAIGAQGQIYAKDKAVLGGFANEGVNALDGAGKVLLKANRCSACGFSIGFIHINQVNIA